MKNKINLNQLSMSWNEKQTPQRLKRYAGMLIMLLTLGVGQMLATDTPPTTKTASNLIIFNSKDEAQSAWMWTDGGGTIRNFTLLGKVGDYYVSTYNNSTYSYSNLIAFKKAYSEGSTDWPGDGNDNKISNNVGRPSLSSNENWYMKETSSGSSNTDPNPNKQFDHLSVSTSLYPNSSVTTGTTVSVRYSSLAGDLKDATHNKWNFFYSTDGGTTKTRFGEKNLSYPTSGTSAPSFTPSVAGSYKVYAYLSDPWGLEVIVREMDLTVSPVLNPVASLPSETKASNMQIFVSHTSAKAQSAWLWTTGEGSCYKMPALGSASTQGTKYLSGRARPDANNFPNAIPFTQNWSDGTNPDWNDSYRLCKNGYHVGNNSTVKNNPEGTNTIVNGNYFADFSANSNTNREDMTQWTAFSHIGGTLGISDNSVDTDEEVTLSVSSIVGSLQGSQMGSANNYFTFYLKDASNNYYRIRGADLTSSSVTFSLETAGTYTCYCFIKDAFKYEEVKLNTQSLTVTAPAATYAVNFGVGTGYSSMGGLTARNTTDSRDLTTGDEEDAGDAITFTADPDDGYEVEGWYTNAACTSGKHDACATIYTVASLGAVQNVYVKFKLIDYTITYKDKGNTAYSGDNSGSLIATYNYGTGVATLVAGTKTGYNFDGWYTNSACTEGPVTSISSSDTGAKIFYAKWTAKTYTVNFSQGAGSGGSSSVTATYGSPMPAATMPTPDNDDYDFDGYYSEASGGGTKYYNSDGSSAHIWDINTNPATLYANYVSPANWYIYGSITGGGWNPTHDNDRKKLNLKYRGISNVYYRSFTLSNGDWYFRFYDETNTQQYEAPSNNYPIAKGTAYDLQTGGGLAFKFNTSGETVWAVLDATNSTKRFWFMSPLYDIDVTSTHGTVTMSTTDAKMDQTVTGTKFASGETVTIVVTPESGYQISSVTFDGDPIDAYSEDGYAKTYFVTMPSSDAELEVVYEEIPPEWKMYYGSTAIGTFELQANGSFRLAMQLTNENASTLNFKLNGVQYKTTSGNLADGSQHSLTQNASNFEWQSSPRNTYYIVTISDDGNDGWQVAATRAYAVTYNGNGNTDGTAPSNQYYAVGETIITATKGDLVKDDLHFYRWNTAADGSGNHYAESASAGTMTSAGLNLYAEWEDLSTGWKIKGGSIFGGSGWDTDIPLVKKSGHSDESIGYYTLSLTESQLNASGGNDNFNFKVIRISDDKWFSLLTGSASNWYYLRNLSYEPRNIAISTITGENIQLCADLAGDYEIKVDYSDVDNPTVQINFPVTGTYNVTLQAGAHGSVSNPGSLTIHQYPKVEITATPEPGYRFVNWTVDGGHSSYISFDNANSATTNVWTTDAAGDGATITANFTNEGFVYFDRSAVNGIWSGDKVYMTCLNGNDLTWDDGTGTLVVKNWVHDDVHNQEMHRIPTSNIYYFDCTGHLPSKILFTDKSHPHGGGENYYKLYDMGAVVEWEHVNLSNDNMYVVENFAWQSKNNTGYFDGYWMKYNETEAGLKLNVYDQHGNYISSHNFETERAGDRQFTTKTGDLSAATTYRFKIEGYNGRFYSNDGEMTNTNCTGWDFLDRVSPNCGFKSTGSGQYEFTLNCTDAGVLKVSMEFPLDVDDYRVMYKGKLKEGAAISDHPSEFIRHLTAAGERDDIISFYVREDWSLQLQICTDVETDPISWDNVGSAITFDDIDDNGVYMFNVHQQHNGTTNKVTITSLGAYTGDYYIRSSAAGGGWEAYKTTPNNKLEHSDYSKLHSGYDYYHCHYVPTGQNVKFTIANDYSTCITDTVDNDAYVTSYGNLPHECSVRFMYNNATNIISRAYLNGSNDGSAEYLKICSDPSRTNKASETKAERPEILDEDQNLFTNNSSIFADLGNWVYQLDLYALEGARVKLISDYRFNNISHNQWFKGKEGEVGEEWDSENTEQIMGGTSNSYHKLRVIYDFKTNHLVAAWLVPDGDIEDWVINADVMIIRTNQGDAEQIDFADPTYTFSNVKTIYSTLHLTYDHIANTGGSTARSAREYYWVSFPYDVKIEDIFGSVGDFNKEWGIMYYDGLSRARNGYWIDSPGFWKYFTSSSATLKAYEGYVVGVDIDMVGQAVNTGKWVNGVRDIYLFFPSSDDDYTIVEDNVTIPITQTNYLCEIDRRVDKETPDIDKDRRIADSYWHCIGTPSFKDETHGITNGFNEGVPNITVSDWASQSLPYVYEWNPSTNTYTPQTGSNYSFKAMYSYIVQYAGASITWNAVSTPSSVAARRMPNQAEYDIEWRLELLQGAQSLDRTYIRMSDAEGVTVGFEFNYDMCKEFNRNKANIYTLIENYIPAAGNIMPTSEQTTLVPVGVKVPANGEYTFAIPDGTQGVGVTLIDNETGARTSLSALEYSIYLTAGDHNERFMLEISPISSMPTEVEVGESQKSDESVRKVIIDGMMYIIREGKMYDARGAMVK